MKCGDTRSTGSPRQTQVEKKMGTVELTSQRRVRRKHMLRYTGRDNLMEHR